MISLKNATGSRLTKMAVIAALYAVTTMCLPFLSYGSVQLRISEALTILPLFFPEAIVGLTVGCLIANFLGNGLLDVVFGTLATFLASVLTYYIGKWVKRKGLKLILGGLPPVVFNAIIVPFTFLAITEIKELYFINVLTVAAGQFLAVYVLGSLLYFALQKRFYN